MSQSFNFVPHSRPPVGSASENRRKMSDNEQCTLGGERRFRKGANVIAIKCAPINGRARAAIRRKAEELAASSAPVALQFKARDHRSVITGSFSLFFFFAQLKSRQHIKRRSKDGADSHLSLCRKPPGGDFWKNPSDGVCSNVAKISNRQAALNAKIAGSSGKSTRWRW